ATYQAMEALVHNLNTMNSRAGAQIPFSSINYGTDTSPEGRMVIKNVLLATEAGLGNGETPIFPIHIFKVKDGLNYNEGDPNYDLFKLACRVSAKRLFPNFSFIDAPYNLQYYKPGDYNTEIAYMGCRTRVIGNVYDPTREIVTGRGNLSFTSINLPRLGILAGGDIVKFFEMLEDRMNLVVDQLLYRFKIQSQKKVKNYPFLMGQGIWIDSEKLNPNDTIGEVLKHGTLSVGFIGLAECLKALIGVHHGESKEAQELGLRIIGRMRARMDEESKKTGLNFSLLATPAEGLSGRFVKIDRKKFGKIEGVTDREYYTNSFHIPVYFPINAFRKIKLEAPYHALTNAGHISYVELDGDPLQNLEAFEQIIRCMKESGIGYGSINHPVDRDPCCGYTGIIGDVCPKCGRSDHGDNTRFERIRRITGYLVGTVDRFNNGKRAEERDRVKHSVSDDDAEI
ncbi:MAG: anaerobic ribonucleoside triphosphate reductase, partial [[Eubacterium] siraeum]